MKKKLFPIIAVAMTLCACNGQNKSDAVSTVDSTAVDSVLVDSTVVDTTVVDSTAQQLAEEKQIEEDIQAIKTFYKKCVLTNNGANEKYALSHATEGMIAKLRKANDYDDGGLAYWVLRTGIQDGDGPSKVKTVKPVGEGWYKVSFIDMGYGGVKEIKMENGKLADYRDSH